ncbi:MAG TPA: hypothetical protein PK756_06190 [Piscinibacter sp.]|nr:hypothetical protein [Piscinibacter sp.]
MHLRSPLLALAMLLAVAGVQAQSYRCSNGSSIYYSDRPCGQAPAGKLGAFGGNSRSAPSAAYAPQLPRAGKAQGHVKYLSPACADISEAIRTAPARGVRGDVVTGLHEEYREKCSLEDQDARRQLRQDEQMQQSEKVAQRDSIANERAQAQQRADQCAGMRDVIALKRSREKQLNETEVAALRSLEGNYNSRCLSR